MNSTYEDNPRDMHRWARSGTSDKPSTTELAMYHTVTLRDIENPGEILKWIMQNKLSITWWQVTDISDFSLETDELFEYWFADEKDAVVFKLRWG